MFIDSNIFIYAFGDDSPYRSACRQFLREVAAGHVLAATSTEAVQEVVHHLLRCERQKQVRTAAEAIVDGVEVIHPVTTPDIRRLLHLVETYPQAACRDLIHVAVMQGAGLDTIVSADRDFDRYQEVHRLDPLRTQ